MKNDILGEWRCFAHQATLGETPIRRWVDKYTDYTFYAGGTGSTKRKGLFGRTVTADFVWEYDYANDGFVIFVGDILWATCMLDGPNSMIMRIAAGLDKGAGYFYTRA